MPYQVVFIDFLGKVLKFGAICLILKKLLLFEGTLKQTEIVVCKSYT